MARPIANRKSQIATASPYWERTHWPLQALYFLLPFIVVYEIGVVLWAGPADIAARRLLRTFFEVFGVTGYYLPGLMVIVVLLCWHVTRRDPWRPEPRLYVLMALEAALLAAPLFVFMMVLYRQPAAPAPGSADLGATPAALVALEGGAAPSLAGGNGSGGLAQIPNWQAGLVFSIGAGIYEEMLFRLIAIALLHLLLVDVLALPPQYGAVGAVGLSAVAFALYHFTEANPFDWGKFFFYTAAGIYFAGIYLLRGFGIVAGTHALYDVLLVVTTQMQRDV